MTAQERKERPVYSGVLRYFPLALLEVAHCSWKGNEQHNPGAELHWDRAKSTDEADALVRHLMDAGTFDTDGVRHSAKLAWRALALLQKELEAAGADVREDSQRVSGKGDAERGADGPCHRAERGEQEQLADVGLHGGQVSTSGWVPTVAPGPHDGSHWTVSAADVLPSEIPESRTGTSAPFVSNEPPNIPNGKLTYDERRSDLKPCKCGAIFTHPERCAASEKCLAEQHPHFRRPLTLAEQRSRNP